MDPRSDFRKDDPQHSVAAAVMHFATFPDAVHDMPPLDALRSDCRSERDHVIERNIVSSGLGGDVQGDSIAQRVSDDAGRTDHLS